MSPKILFIIQNNTFPFDQRVYNETKSLFDNGFDVSVYCPKTKDSDPSSETIDGIKVSRFKNLESKGTILGYCYEYAYSVFKIYFHVILFVLKHKPDAVHFSNPPDFFWPLKILFKLFHTKFVYDQHDIFPEMFKQQYSKSFVYKFLNFNEKQTVKCANGIIFPNNSFKERAINKYNLVNKITEIVINGPRENFSPYKNDALIEKYKGHKIVLYIGLMGETDGIENVIDLAEKIKLKDNKMNIKFVLVGDGPVKKKYENLTIEKGLKDLIEFVGLLPHHKVAEYLFLSDVCIVPDPVNGINEYMTLIKVFEYMKAEKPFISFDLLETKNIAEKSGIYVKNIDDFKEKLIYLLENPEESNKIGTENKKIIDKKYLWKFSEKKLLNFYYNLLGLEEPEPVNNNHKNLVKLTS